MLHHTKVPVIRVIIVYVCFYNKVPDTSEAGVQFDCALGVRYFVIEIYVGDDDPDDQNLCVQSVSTQYWLFP